MLARDAICALRSRPANANLRRRAGDDLGPTGARRRASTGGRAVCGALPARPADGAGRRAFQRAPALAEGVLRARRRGLAVGRRRQRLRRLPTRAGACISRARPRSGARGRERRYQPRDGLRRGAPARAGGIGALLRVGRLARDGALRRVGHGGGAGRAATRSGRDRAPVLRALRGALPRLARQRPAHDRA